MTTTQRTALLDMMSAILACDCAPADIRLRAQTLRILVGYGNALGSIFGR